MTEADLIRFVNAQSQIYAQVVEELTSGRNSTHWMWFIFPQLAGLGRSAMADRYAIRDLDQARRYLNDPILGSRLRQLTGRPTGNGDAQLLEINSDPMISKAASSGRFNVVRY